MNLTSLLSPDCTICAAPANSKKNILEQISLIAANKISSASAKDLLNGLINREKLSSTGIGNGIAIPHVKIDNSEKPIAVLMTCDKPIDFDAIDNRPVDIFFALFVPEDSCQQHLQTLANVARFFADKDTSKKVRRCLSAEQLYALVAEK
ncbi:PTS IIA-like nitrogen regulatory protein PtsN [Thalassotalea maritima]|uniref:PTS IIA-like nitrogen regulatory protein PtsN n=1 Tax=Thalassotalea maritima TaxID=3242416 RepID=UPI00352785E7